MIWNIQYIPGNCMEDYLIEQTKLANFFLQTYECKKFEYDGDMKQ